MARPAAAQHQRHRGRHAQHGVVPVPAKLWAAAILAIERRGRNGILNLQRIRANQVFFWCFSAFAARFSRRVLTGFFFVSRFWSKPLLTTSTPATAPGRRYTVSQLRAGKKSRTGRDFSHQAINAWA
jgi:hypothetical protein